MQLAKYEIDGRQGVAIVDGDILRPLLRSGQSPLMTEILDAASPAEMAHSLLAPGAEFPVSSVRLLAPIDRHEVWAAGVTYRRSRTARMEESQGAARFYDLVYEAPRPEIFFKANPHRVSGPGQAVRIRQDAKWNVPEPELALVINSRLELVGFTIGNDMSSRDIEGENPLYLPQAKVYDACCGLGPWVTLASAMPEPEATKIELVVRRQNDVVFSGTTNLGQLNRTYDELIGWLGRDNSFPNGAILLTGTGIVPDDTFTLKPNDLVEISIDGIGQLSNHVVQRSTEN